MALPLWAYVQWGGAGLAIVGAWLVGSQRRGRRQLGFWCFLLSNVLLIAWAVPLPQHAGIIAMQLAFTVTSIRGIALNRGAGA